MNDNLILLPVTDPTSLQAIAGLAKKIWTEHYLPILGQQQIDYMLERFQSVHAMQCQITEEGYEYYLIRLDGQNAGYIGVKPDEKGLFLSKLYVDKAFRRRGIAARVLNVLTGRCLTESRPVIWLTVNKYNEGSIAAYRALGFSIVRDEVTDIGNGYVMDDYIMEKNV